MQANPADPAFVPAEVAFDPVVEEFQAEGTGELNQVESLAVAAYRACPFLAAAAIQVDLIAPAVVAFPVDLVGQVVGAFQVDSFDRAVEAYQVGP